MNLLLLNAASGSKLEQALEKLVDFGMDAGKDIFVAILIYSVGRFIIKQISVLIAKVLEKRKIETSVQTFLKSLVKILLHMDYHFLLSGGKKHKFPIRSGQYTTVTGLQPPIVANSSYK